MSHGRRHFCGDFTGQIPAISCRVQIQVNATLKIPFFSVPRSILYIQYTGNIRRYASFASTKKLLGCAKKKSEATVPNNSGNQCQPRVASVTLTAEKMVKRTGRDQSQEQTLLIPRAWIRDCVRGWHRLQPLSGTRGCLGIRSCAQIVPWLKKRRVLVDVRPCMQFGSEKPKKTLQGEVKLHRDKARYFGLAN